MENWFYNPNIQFHMWDSSHLLTIFIIVVLLILIFTLRKRLTPFRRPIRLIIGVLLILSRLSLDLWYITTDQWTAQSSLPLELCSIASLLAGVMLLTKSRFLFEVLYFIAISGAVMAIVTPDLYFGFPQYRYIQFFFDHFLLILAPLLMIWLYHYQLTWRSVFKSLLFLNGLAGVVFIINQLISANYMFLREKPSGASLLDVLGPYPYYLLSLEFIALSLFFLLYLPVFNSGVKR
ncbi:TIGR02206 family membrane protein [Virgibacillus sp. MSJ-26]|uniref:YwaF family protein n=1 Tax=Virgibacillus sp. MSJ-26 TaxID=2841522 RepID=UPI001C11C740|nr:TIGR02206 family membrane protein [Virgibacillus sp. MSJ-26]MBU5468051.1 TIGR02206 family membrane protein [Virgibacillus sp. MSJ-26]